MLKVGFEKPEKCYQCGRCTSGCTVAKVLKDYRPNRMVGFVRHGMGKKAINESLWYCARCLKCVEYCPQKVAPADVVLSLQHQAVSGGAPFPEAYRAMVEKISETGLAFQQMEVTDRDFETWSRGSAGLPPVPVGGRAARIAKIVSMIEKGEL
ncbi:MAG: 4Fe-4S dicluster domain-containing protein [Candidatus Brockarchaeota archaeon]|nr:4Fe-4S dicluster domain-containing protein [Candidatus Brockarchaeota archaeon]